MIIMSLSQTQGKGGTPAMVELIADMDKISAKLSNAEQLYNEQNGKTKRDILAAKELQDELLDTLLLTMVVCQVKNIANLL
jgi:hypothetical protein